VAKKVKVYIVREVDLKKVKRDLYKVELAKREVLRVKGVTTRATK
jgi:hypothetical protein